MKQRHNGGFGAVRFDHVKSIAETTGFLRLRVSRWFQVMFWPLASDVHCIVLLPRAVARIYNVRLKALLRSESPSGECAKLHTVEASNNRDGTPCSVCYCLFTPHIEICGILRAHPVRRESRIQRHADQEIAAAATGVGCRGELNTFRNSWVMRCWWRCTEQDAKVLTWTHML